MIKSIKDFGALGNGVYDDYTAFQRALDSGENEIYIPQGIYPVSETLKIHSNTKIIAEKTAKICMQSTRKRRRNEFLISNSDTEKGNKDIRISGGIWDGLNTLSYNQKANLFDSDGYSGALLNFINVDGLELSDMVLANSVTYYIRMGRVENFKIEDINLVSDNFGANQDGIHFSGGVKRGRVKNVRALSFGQSNDDMIAFNADDCVERVENFDLTRDTIEDITVENVYAENCHSIIRLLSVTAEIKNICLKNIYGGFRCNAINADAARYCKTPIFNDDDYPNGVGKISNVIIDNFTCFPVLELPENFGGTLFKPQTAISLESKADNFKITNFNYITDTKTAKICPALIAKNITNQKLIFDENNITVDSKSETVKINNFKKISII